MNDLKVDVLAEAALCLCNAKLDSAAEAINTKYPFIPVKSNGRNYTIKQMMNQFFSDGFIDRYSGKRLVNPGMLRTLSQMMPKAFPYQAHWKTEECHIAYWEYQPTIDHIYPVSLGGADSKENWATTSMMNNSAKSNFTLEQLNWTLKSKGDIREWDGLSRMFVDIVEKNQSLLEIERIKNYYVATKETMEEFGLI